MIEKTENGWRVDFYPFGKKTGPRVRKQGFKTRLDALQFVRDYGRKDYGTGERLKDLVKKWYDYHGHTLKDAKYRLSRTNAICDRLGNPRVKDFTATDWMEYRALRMQDVSAGTCNHEQRYLSSVFSEMVRIGHLKTNPIAPVRQVRVREREMSFLTIEQCKQLLDECRKSTNHFVWSVAMICLATGARWAEAETLTQSSIVSGKVIFRDTKNGKSRAVPIDPNIQEQVLENALPGPGRLFGPCRSAFRSAYERCGFSTPQQLTHILRHTFASHYMMNGGDILTLQCILGHGNITMTMRYAHLSPDHLESAVRLSPVSALSLKR
ncbi:phage integrase [Marinobacter nauticus]|uniref:phage integrase n=1 Tax=Marinobacter nauticus TaxID=2743 RepID=UPI002431AFE8|nr:tyrosine-type recombinase/integrase [Marinobacter nauticus]